MSRGPGTVQRRLLDVLAEQDRPIDTIELAVLAFDVQPNAAGQCVADDAQTASVRRALGRLAQAGKIVALGRNWGDGRRRWASPAAAQRYRERVKAVFG